MNYQPLSFNRAKRDEIKFQELLQRHKESKPPNKKAKKSCISPWILTIILLFGMVLSAIGQPAGYQIIKPSPGLYVEQIGTCQVNRGNLRLEVKLPLADIYQEEKDLERVLCYVHHIEQEGKDVQQQISKIKLLTNKRKRRGLFGKLLQAVFGVNDEVYADIEVLEKNQHTVVDTVNNHNLQINLQMNQTSIKIAEKLRQFDQKIRESQAALNQLGSWFGSVNSNTVGIHLLSTLATAANYVEEAKEKYNKLEKFILKKGSIMDFISIETIDDAIQRAKQSIGSTFSIHPLPQD